MNFIIIRRQFFKVLSCRKVFSPGDLGVPAPPPAPHSARERAGGRHHGDRRAERLPPADAAGEVLPARGGGVPRRGPGNSRSLGIAEPSARTNGYMALTPPLGSKNHRDNSYRGCSPDMGVWSKQNATLWRQKLQYKKGQGVFVGPRVHWTQGGGSDCACVGNSQPLRSPNLPVFLRPNIYYRGRQFF